MNVLATLHLADLYRDPRMTLPTKLDWKKIPRFLAGQWPEVVPPRIIIEGDEPPFELDAILWGIPQGHPVAIDTEYDRHTKKLDTIGIGWRDAAGQITGVQIHAFQRFSTGAQQYVSDLVRATLKRRRPVYQNTLADAPVLEQNCGVRFPQDYPQGWDDTMLAHAVLWSEWPHSLEFLQSIYAPYPKLKHLGATQPLLYNWGDVISTLWAWECLARELDQDPPSKLIYLNQSLKIMPELARAKRRGVMVNAPFVKPAHELYAAKILAAERMAQAYLGWPINLGSTQQLQKYLYGELELPVQLHKKTKKRTLDGDAVAALREFVGPTPDPDEELTAALALERVEEGADPILEARVIYADATQVQSHYLEPAVRALKGDGRFRPDQLIHAQATGRWSTNEPPLAQLPSDLRGNKTGTRRAGSLEIDQYSPGIIRPDPGYVWLCWDWDQAELRINAALSGDTPSITAFRNGWDLHTLNMCDCFGLPYPPDRRDPHRSPECADWRDTLAWEGKDDIRRVFGKRFIFRSDYGGDPARAGDIPGAKRLGLTSRHLVQAAQRYLAQHPQKAEWRGKIARQARETGYIRSFMGRRRRLLGDRKKAIREAFNAPMQIGVVEIFNTTFVRITEELPWLEWVFGMHDAQFWACPADQVDETWPLLAPIITATWDIEGEATVIPATFKEVRCT